MSHVLSILISGASFAVALFALAFAMKPHRRFDQLIRSRLLSIVKNLIWLFLTALFAAVFLIAATTITPFEQWEDAFADRTVDWGTYLLAVGGGIFLLFAGLAVVAALYDLWCIAWIIRDEEWYSRQDHAG